MHRREGIAEGDEGCCVSTGYLRQQPPQCHGSKDWDDANGNDRRFERAKAHATKSSAFTLPLDRGKQHDRGADSCVNLMKAISAHLTAVAYLSSGSNRVRPSSLDRFKLALQGNGDVKIAITIAKKAEDPTAQVNAGGKRLRT